ncbi:MAG: raffinose/stachyose/melibiose transport system permease protein [Frankiales bacterium]|jgi:ABC-type glycerol-3-phosphate transport system permease component|nr:raffinose/stachyose/melibiose transport system permease protein [Frankiales bacterium]
MSNAVSGDVGAGAAATAADPLSLLGSGGTSGKAASAKRRRRRVGGRLIPRLVVTGLSIGAIIWLLPIAYLISVSLRTPDHAFDPTIISTDTTLANYRAVFHDNPMLHYFVNSVVVAGISTLVVVAAGATFAYGFTVLKLRYTTAVYLGLLVTLMVPISSLVIPLGSLLQSLGLVNTYWGLIGPYAALGIPFAVVVLAGFMHDLPRDVFEASIIDGVGGLRLLTSIVLPMLRPSLIFVAVWQFITSWNEFFLALTIETKDAMKTLPLIPQQYSGVYLGNPGALFAILCLVAGPLILLYLAIQRWFVGGLLEGAVKG